MHFTHCNSELLFIAIYICQHPTPFDLDFGATTYFVISFGKYYRGSKIPKINRSRVPGGVFHLQCSIHYGALIRKTAIKQQQLSPSCPCTGRCRSVRCARHDTSLAIRRLRNGARFSKSQPVYFTSIAMEKLKTEEEPKSLPPDTFLD